MYYTSTKSCIEGFDFFFVDLRALSNLWWRYDGYRLKRPNVKFLKRPNVKTSQSQNVPSQNVPESKRPKSKRPKSKRPKVKTS